MHDTALTTTNIAGVTPALAYLASLKTPTSRAGMKSELNKVARELLHIDSQHRRPDDWQQVNWQTLNAANIRALSNAIAGKPASRNKTLSALRGVARSCYEMGLIDADAWQRIQLVKAEQVQSDDETLEGRMIEDWEIVALMRACAKDATAAGARDAAMIALAAKTGARRAELAGIRMETITPTADGYEIKITGKRGKMRTLYADNGAAKALADWLALRGEYGGHLFVQITQRGEMRVETHLSTTALDKILRKRCDQAGVTDADWHDFRRTNASKLLDVGEDIATVAALLGHASVNTTKRYDRRPAEARRKAARKISVPYFERKATINTTK
jgi:integrase